MLFTRRFVLAWVANLAQEMAWSLFVQFPGFLLGLGAGEVEIGFLVGLTAFSSVVVRPWVGRAMDVYGRRPVIIAGNLLNVGVLALYLTVTTLGPWIYVVRILHGFAAALLFTSLFTYGADQVPAARRTEGLALFGVSGLLPIALGGLLGDLILASGTFTTLFFTALGFGGLALVLSIPLKDEREPTEEPPHRFMQSVTSKDLLPLWWLGLVFAIALTAYFTFIKTFVVETGIGSVGAFFCCLLRDRDRAAPVRRLRPRSRRYDESALPGPGFDDRRTRHAVSRAQCRCRGGSRSPMRRGARVHLPDHVVDGRHDRSDRGSGFGSGDLHRSARSRDADRWTDSRRGDPVWQLSDHVRSDRGVDGRRVAGVRPVVQDNRQRFARSVLRRARPGTTLVTAGRTCSC
jgi:hypothetical protein